MIIFLVIILIAGLLLFAVIGGAAGRGSGGKKRGKRGGGSSRTPARINVAEKWGTIQTISAGGPSGLKNAVSEADKLVDYALKQQGFPGETMADRLKAARTSFSSYSFYDGIWRAHKLRNALAHEVGFDFVPSQAREALTDFERGLKDLGAL
jgi:hypothetical protein